MLHFTIESHTLRFTIMVCCSEYVDLTFRFSMLYEFVSAPILSWDKKSQVQYFVANDCCLGVSVSVFRRNKCSRRFQKPHKTTIAT